jgi:hypothetical protein
MDVCERKTDSFGYCGIWCGGCALGNGAFASRAAETAQHIREFKLEEWASFVPGGAEVDVPALARGLDWIASHVACPKCEQGGGPPECKIRDCAKGRALASCADCADMETCGSFDWLLANHADIKENLRELHLLGREAYLEKLSGA